MALIKCSECGKEVSTKATACPHCGCPAAVTLQRTDHPAEPQPASKPPEQRYEKWEGCATQPATAPPAPEEEARRGRELLRRIGIFLYIVGFTILSAAFSDQNRGWAFFWGSLTVILAWGLRLIAADLATKRKGLRLGSQVLLCSMSALLLAGILMMSNVFNRGAVEQQIGGLPKVLTQDEAGTPLMEAVKNHDLNTENTGGKARLTITKAEWLRTLESRYGQEARLRIVDLWEADDFKKFMGNPSSTSTVEHQVFWYYECSDGQFQIELNLEGLVEQGVMFGRINDY